MTDVDETPARRDPATGKPLSKGAHGRYRPFQPGHLEAMKHGSYLSDQRLSSNARVQELAEAIRETQPVSHPADEGTVQRLAIVYWRIERSAEALDAVDEAGDAISAYLGTGAVQLSRLREDHARWHGVAARIEEQLARTPASRAKLGLHLALGERALTVVDLHRQAAIEAESETKEAG